MRNVPEKGLRDGKSLIPSGIWLVGQAVKTPASHAGNAGSIPARVTKDSKRKRKNRKRCIFTHESVINIGSVGEKPIQRVGVESAEGPPVPIPNTEVKLSSAEDTWLATAWENRETPT